MVLFFGVAPSYCQYVTLTGNIQASNGGVAQGYTINFTPSQWLYIAGTGVVVNTTSSCGTSIGGAVVGIPDPQYPTIVTPQFTGNLPPSNYYVEYTFVGGGQESLPSPEIPVQLTSTGGIQVHPPANGIPAAAVAMNIYVGATSGSETLQGSSAGQGVFTLGAPLVSGVSPPTTNNSICKQVANDAGWPTGTGYNVTLVDPSGNILPGYPMLWQLLGPNTTINLSNGLPYYHGIVAYPSPILASPLNHAAQSISGPLNLGGYALNGVGALTAASVNSTVNAALQNGSDIGADVNLALASCASQCTIYVPAGNYTFSTQISLPLNVFGAYKLLLDAGAVLTYTGSSDAIVTPIGANGPGEAELIIEGGQLIGTASAASGIHLYPTNRVTVQQMLIEGFTNGDGIRVEGTNSSNILNNNITNNLNGVHLIPTFCTTSYPYTCSGTTTGTTFTPNAIHIAFNQIAGNLHWGYWDDRNNVSTGGPTGTLNTSVTFNDLELNGVGTSTYGAVYVMHSTGEIIEGNYLEGSPRQIVLGELGAGSSLRTSGPIVRDNYFTTSPPVSPATTQYQIELQDTIDALVEGNSELVTANVGTSNCFIEAATSGETRTLISRNAIFENNPSGNPICVNGTAANNLVGAGSGTLITPGYQPYVAYGSFSTTSATTDTIAVQFVTANGACFVSPVNSSAKSDTAAWISAVAAGSLTFTHSATAGELFNIWCANNPSGGFGYP